MDRQICKRLLLSAAILIAVSAAPGRVAAQGSGQKPDAQEIYLSFNYSGLVNTFITCLYYKDSVYLPIGTIFKQLRVDREIDMKTRTIKGFFIDASDPYVIDFINHTAQAGTRQIKFDSSQIIVGDLDFYMLPSLFRRLFDLSFSTDINALSLTLNTDLELPVVKDYQREARRNFLITAPQSSLIQAELLYPRKRSWLNGGILDYSVSSFFGAGQSAYSYSLTGGAEVLGGDAQGSVLGSVSRGMSNLYSSNLSWKYAFDSSRYISMAGVGNLYSEGLAQYGFRGVQVTNEPVTVRTYFSKYEITAKTTPNWDVELYLNGQLVGYQRADAGGEAHFSIPLVYGTSYLQLKYYGPSGEFQETDKRLQIPFTFVPSGEVDYSISAGKLNNTDYDLLEGNVIVGLTDWMTDKLGTDYVNSPYYSKPAFYNSLSMRFSPEYMLSIDASPSAFYRATFNALYPSQSAFDLMFARYASNLLYNPGGRDQELQGDMYFPISFEGGGVSLRAAGDALQYLSGQKTYSYSLYASTGVSQFNFALGYVGSEIDFGAGLFQRSNSLTASLLYSLFFGQGAFDFLNGSLVNTTARYGVLKNSIDDIQFEISKNVQQYIRVGIAAERDFVNRFTSFNLQIIADLPFTRSTTTAQTQQGNSWFSENVSGAVGFDANYRNFVFNDQQWVGHSASSMRMFVDNNGNGKYDPGEAVIQDGAVTLRQGVASETSQNGVIREWNLLPYTQYSADIDIASIKNPLWIPRQKSFSFVTDPESYKRIDIPFFVGGIVDGSVVKLEGGYETAIPGLTIEVKSLGSTLQKTLSVFNDGSFYYMGLPPGDYEAYVDSSQLSILGVYAEPAIIRFQVKPTKDGDYVEGLKMVLQDKVPPSTGALMKPPEKEIASAAPATKYVVQIGAFTEKENAQAFARLARDRSGITLSVSVNPVSNLYVVQTDSFGTKQDALDRLDVFMNHLDYDDAFLVCLRGGHCIYTFSVHLAAFQSLGAAAEYSEVMRKDIGMTPTIQLNRTTRMFSVVLGPFENEGQATAMSDRLKKVGGYESAFVVISGQSEVPKMYAVSLGSFPNRNSADEFADEFRQRTGLIALVDFDGKKMRFIDFTPTYQTDSEAMKILDKIRSFKGYTSAQLISLP
ncbi:MAG TPA: SPOR domain-containing protein [Candidatus Kryptonia bacterium]